jgi:AraC-like DNA-binding protein
MHTDILYSGSLVRIIDYRCRPDHPDCSAEECSGGHHLVFPRTGVFVKHVRGERIIAEPSQVLFFNAGEPYRVSHPVPGGDDCTVLAFPREVLLEALGSQDPRVADRPDRPFRRTHAPARPRALLPQRALHHRLRRGRAGALEAEETALGLLAEMARDTGIDQPAQRRRERAANARLRRDWVEAVRLLIAGRPEADLSLAEVSHAVHCSPFHLARLFRAAQGLPIHQYQLRLRLVLALDRLLDERVNLLTLALDLGFASHSHFTAAFRRAFGTTPATFRRTANGRRVQEMRKIVTV